MKYMGSKQAMLRNGLGELLAREASQADRFVDLLTGSGCVAAHVAARCRLPVSAYDLQRYGAVLAGAVVQRVSPIAHQSMWRSWHSRANAIVEQHEVPSSVRFSKTTVLTWRKWSSRQSTLPMTCAYGGHYFSPAQAMWLDALRATLPAREPHRTVALAALVRAASQCVASPGHTAQPLQPTKRGLPFIQAAWSRHVATRTRTALEKICGEHALCQGTAAVAEANVVAATLAKGDLVFVDPPYSSVHYSRFYHVLESLVVGHCGGAVSGTGRYPATSLRPRSNFSVRTKASHAFEQLIRTLADVRATVLVTFPAHTCSNGLSGDRVNAICSRHFRVAEARVKSRFSTLGGVGGDGEDEDGRKAWRDVSELILCLRPFASRKRQHAARPGRESR